MTTESPNPSVRSRRLGRAERRDQIVEAATKAFTREGGFAHTKLDDVADAAGVTRMILYRHFDSKADLYRAVIDRSAERLHAAATEGGALHDSAVANVVEWARANPDGFRLLFRQAATEPVYRDDVRQLRNGMAETVRPYVDEAVSDERWADWAAQVTTTVVIEAIAAWLDAGQPDPEQATERILRVVEGAVRGATGD